MMAPGVQPQRSLFDRITRVAMQLVGVVGLFLGILLCLPGLGFILLGTWVLDRGRGA
jgi:preprotein translocase subunit SecY